MLNLGTVQYAGM